MIKPNKCPCCRKPYPYKTSLFNDINTGACSKAGMPSSWLSDPVDHYSTCTRNERVHFSADFLFKCLDMNIYHQLKFKLELWREKKVVNRWEALKPTWGGCVARKGGPAVKSVEREGKGGLDIEMGKEEAWRDCGLKAFLTSTSRTKDSFTRVLPVCCVCSRWGIKSNKNEMWRIAVTEKFVLYCNMDGTWPKNHVETAGYWRCLLEHSVEYWRWICDGKFGVFPGPVFGFPSPRWPGSSASFPGIPQEPKPDLSAWPTERMAMQLHPRTSATNTTSSHLLQSRLFLCDLCDATFTSSSGLKLHTNCVHLKKYPYACTVCGKRFTLKEHYNDHMSMHNKVKAHKCPNCCRPFTFKTSLRKHLRDRICKKSWILTGQKCQLVQRFLLHWNRRCHEIRCALYYRLTS